MEMNRKHPRASRVLAICLVVMMVFSLMPAGFGQMAYADSGSEEKLYEVKINVSPKEANVTFYQGNNADTALDDSQVTDKGEVDGYHQYILNVPEGRYSYRGVEGDTQLGGMTFDVPFDEEIMYDPETGGGKPSGKGLVLTLKRVNYYTNDKNIKDIGDYSVHAIPAGMPEVVCGPQYKDESERVVTPAMVTARGNALVYTVNFDIHDEYVKSHYSIPQSPNDTFEESAGTGSRVFTLTSTVIHTIIAPKDAKAQVFKQLNNFNVAEIEETSQIENADGTVTHQFTTPGGLNLTYRVSMEGKITRAGFFGSDPETITVTYGDSEDPKSIEFGGQGGGLRNRVESSTLVNVNGQNNLILGVGEEFRLRGYRAAWQLINTDTANIMIEPDFNYEIISGGEHIEMTPVTGQCTGNAGEGEQANWWDIKGISEGVAVIEISYDSIIIGGKGTSTHGTWGATNPQRKSMVVIHVGGQENSLKMYAEGFDLTWDTEYDTVYFVEDTGQMTFTATLGEERPDKVELSTDKGFTWKEVTSADGKYIAEGLVPGNNILKFTKGDKVEYQVVRGAKISYTITNKTHDFEGVYAVGDVLEVKFDGIFMPIPKISGIYNPGYGDTHWFTFENADDVSLSSYGVQYQFPKNHKLTITLKEAGEIELKNGKIGSMVLGHMYLIGDHRLLTDSGCGVNFSAGGSNHENSILPTIKLTVHEKSEIPVTINTNADDVTATFTDATGKSFTFEGNTGALVFGNYDYVIMAPGYRREEGKLSISPDAKSSSIDVSLVKTEETTWDGQSSEQAPVVDGVYQISTANQLVWFAQQVNAGTGSDWDAILLNDISLGKNNPWTPINEYSGTFDGNGHFINDLYIVSSSSNQALFGKTADEATIKNLGVSGTVKTTGNNTINTAGIVAEAVTGTKIENCTNAVQVTGIRNVGGIVGRAWGKTIISNCYNTGAISANQFAGGVIGQISIASGEQKLITVKQCYNTGIVSAIYGSIGAITYGDYAYLVKKSYYLEGSCSNTTLVAGTKVTSDELKALAQTLGSAYLTGVEEYNNGYPVLTWEEGKILPYVAEDAIADIEGYKNPADYRDAQKTELTNAITAAKTAINSAKTIEEINKAVIDAKTAMDQIKTDAQLKAEEEAAHKHSYVKETVDAKYLASKATCTAAAKYYKSCECGEKGTATFTSGKALGHKEVTVKGKAATCTKTGLTDGKKCSVCNTVTVKQQTIKAKGHNYSDTYTVDKAASATKNGSKSRHCTRCDAKTSVKTIYKLATAKLGTTIYTYNAKVKSPKVILKDSKGNTISSKNYTVTKAKGRKNVGKYTYKVTFKNEYKGIKAKTFTFKINPQSTKITSLTKGKKSFTVKWSKKTTQTTGYQIYYSTSKTRTNGKQITISKNTTTKKTISKLKGGKKYYVWVRTYKTVDGKKYYSDWSARKYVTTKK